MWFCYVAPGPPPPRPVLVPDPLLHPESSDPAAIEHQLAVGRAGGTGQGHVVPLKWGGHCGCRPPPQNLSFPGKLRFSMFTHSRSDSGSHACTLEPRPVPPVAKRNSIDFGKAPQREADSQPISQSVRQAVSQAVSRASRQADRQKMSMYRIGGTRAVYRTRFADINRVL